jgi:hypothetical protein
MQVDQFTTAEARTQFDQRLDAILKTADHYNINQDNAVIIGGAALTLHGLDTYVPELSNGEPFDVDAIIVQAARYRQGWRPAVREYFLPRIPTDRKGPLPLTRIKGTASDEFARLLLGYKGGYDEMMEDRVIVHGLATPSRDTLVFGKYLAGRDGVRREGRIKDHAGLIKAHVVAEATGHEVVNDPYWRRAIELTVGSVVEAPSERIAREQWPEWLTELAQNNFDHPAFKGLHEK